MSINNITPDKATKQANDIKLKNIILKDDILTILTESGDKKFSDHIQNYTLKFYDIQTPLIGKNYLEVIFSHPALDQPIILKANDNEPTFEKLKDFCKYMKKNAKVDIVKNKNQLIQPKKGHPILLVVGILAIIFILFSGNSDNTSVDSTVSNQYAKIENLDIPTEYKSAFKKAIIYSDTMYMSKAGIYEQLTSEFGENFSSEAAQYAVENLEADYNSNALVKAKSYSDDMHMSKLGIYDQLISEYGEKFTKTEAQYAVDNLDADYKQNALEKAKSYQDMGMSSSEIRDQLCSEYGEKFTKAEASYAVKNLHNN